MTPWPSPSPGSSRSLRNDPKEYEFLKDHAQALCQLITSFIYYFEPGEFHILEKEFVLFSQSCQKTHKKVFSGLRFSLALTQMGERFKTRDEP